MRRGSFIFIALLAAWLTGCASGAKAFSKTQAGNMIVRHGGPSGSQAMDYDPENRLTRFSQAGTTVVEYGYAADGTCLWKRVNQDQNQIQDWIGKIYEEKGGKVLYHVFAGDRQVCTFEAGSKLDGGSDTTRGQAFGQAKAASGVPTSQQFDTHRTILDNKFPEQPLMNMISPFQKKVEAQKP